MIPTVPTGLEPIANRFPKGKGGFVAAAEKELR
jgi:hypothetical protein